MFSASNPSCKLQHWQRSALLILTTVIVGQGPYEAGAATPDQKTLPRGLAPHEVGLPLSSQLGERTDAPLGPIFSLGEWEEPEAVMTLWENPSLVEALSKGGPVRLLSDTESEISWWKNWLTQNKILAQDISYFVVPTDSIWIRDYGPWFIIDGRGQFGMVDTIYNRPRPKDDVVPDFLANELGIPNYKPGLVHTGGNYYSDSLGNAFSSTLVFDENPSLNKTDILSRMLAFLGIERYTTSDLGKKITIEHLDTFGKLVAPDTWVFSQFPQNSRFYQDSERMVALLKTLMSPYGTPYKIHRLPMTTDGGSENFRAYINSFISGRRLYMATYAGDSTDEAAKQVYRDALPGYEVVGVDAKNTRWGDSVHCRTRNLLQKKTIFIFPKVLPMTVGQPVTVQARVLPTPGSTLTGPPQIFYKTGTTQGVADMTLVSGVDYAASLPAVASGAELSFYIQAKDTTGKIKTHPFAAPEMQIRVKAP